MAADPLSYGNGEALSALPLVLRTDGERMRATINHDHSPW